MPNYIEYNAVKNHADEIAALGSCAIIITGKNSARKCGALEDVTSVLEGAGVRWILFDRVEENPSIETVMEARNLGVSGGADLVIGIGGGSPMDAAKAVAVMIKNSSRDWELLYENEQAGGVPVVCIPTTCGTGSEVTAVSVLTRHDLKTKLTAKQKLFPDLALVDPGYLACASASIIRNTSIDAMGHMIESYVNKGSTRESREYSLKGLGIWGEVRQFAANGLPEDPDEQKKVLLKLATASNFGGYSIVTPGTSLPHGMSYVLTYEKGVPHGMAIGIFLPGYLEYADIKDRDILLNAMGFGHFRQFKDFIKDNCIRPMFDNYLNREEFLALAGKSAESFMSNTSRIAKIPYHMDKDILYGMIARIAEYSAR